MIHHTAISPDADDSIDTIRAQMYNFTVEPLGAADEQKLKEAVPKFSARLVNWPKKK